jgi:K+-sensing histidine kinase KdpD
VESTETTRLKDRERYQNNPIRKEQVKAASKRNALKNKDKIFDMFFRASNTSTGTGLGLYICKQIVDKLNGKLELITSEETGSLFRVTLPEYQKEA